MADNDTNKDSRTQIIIAAIGGLVAIAVALISVFGNKVGNSTKNDHDAETKTHSKNDTVPSQLNKQEIKDNRGVVQQTSGRDNITIGVIRADSIPVQKKRKKNN